MAIGPLVTGRKTRSNIVNRAAGLSGAVGGIRGKTPFGTDDAIREGRLRRKRHCEMPRSAQTFQPISRAARSGDKDSRPVA